jgi:hypothetical protein
MRTPPAARWFATVTLIGGLGLAACNDKITDDAADAAPEGTAAELVPFDSDPFGNDEGEDPSVDPQAGADADDGSDGNADNGGDSNGTDSDSDGDSDSDAGSDSDSDPGVQTIDPLPGDTVVSDTRPEDDPLCEAAQGVLDLDEEYQEILAKAIDQGVDNPAALAKALDKLPVEDIRDAYDDLAAEVPQNLRRRVATIRDFTVEHGRELLEVEDLEGLSELIAEIEADPDAAKVTRATAEVSAYTEEECGLRIAQGG